MELKIMIVSGVEVEVDTEVAEDMAAREAAVRGELSAQEAGIDEAYGAGRKVRLKPSDLDDLTALERQVLARRIRAQLASREPDLAFVLGAKSLVLSEDQARRFLDAEPVRSVPGLPWPERLDSVSGAVLPTRYMSLKAGGA